MFKEINEALNLLTEKIIGSAIEVHKQLGPGLLESVYEEALCCELRERGVNFEKQVVVPIIYKENEIGKCRLDLLVEGEVIIELKAVDRIEPLFEAQVLTYLKITGKRLGLLINFNSTVLKNGIKRIIL
ncbi:MAG TPA: GxxExxY protein [Spirochaetota bacterium]|nr:GxxExxY protein [Spirochaetota bacterium]HPI89235.1 GxxExxY protein [Spirochaetota bacterium]HPR48948.1 GxxExxY protein [Spirochaetota bacterium]